MNVLLFVSLSCLLSAVVFVLLARAFFFIVRVEGRSMSPTLVDDDRLLALRLWPARWLRRQQIVVTRYPETRPPHLLDTFTEQKYIKRVTGLPGDTITIDRPNFPPLPAPDDPLQPRTWHIPPGHYFVQSDSWGLDSTTLGPIPFRALCGVALVKLRRRPEVVGSQATAAAKNE
jgi:signal peptidase I